MEADAGKIQSEVPWRIAAKIDMDKAKFVWFNKTKETTQTKFNSYGYKY